MDQDLSSNESLKQYLLGKLPRYQRKQIERNFFEDTDFLNRLLDAERQLITDYNQGSLESADRVLFEQRFRDGAHKSRWIAENEDALHGMGLRVREPGRKDGGGIRIWSWMPSLTPALFPTRTPIRFAVVASVVLAVVLLALWVWLRGTRSPLNERLAQQANEAPSPSQSPQAGWTPMPTSSPDVVRVPQPSPSIIPRPDQKTTPHLPARVVVATLQPGITRSPHVPTVQIDLSNLVRLEVPVFGATHESYTADIRDQDKRLTKRLPARRPQTVNDATKVYFEFPANLLVSDYYYLELFGASAGGRKVLVDVYPFNVEHK
jgi:hypothetical protein